jgi:Uma2 family endonuclease
MTAIGTATETVPDQVVCFPGTWQLFRDLLENQGDESGAKIAFDGELIEIMSPNYPHDHYARFIARLIYEVNREWGVRISSAGATTILGEPRGGAQPDESFHLVPRKDPATNPPPDLIVEVDLTTPAARRLNKLKLYAAFGVREFWRYRHGATFEAFTLVDGTYEPTEISVVLAGLPIGAVRQQILTVDLLADDWETIRPWQQWLREHKP